MKGTWHRDWHTVSAQCLLSSLLSSFQYQHWGRCCFSPHLGQSPELVLLQHPFLRHCQPQELRTLSPHWTECSGDRTLIKFGDPPGTGKSRQQGGLAIRAKGSLDTNQESFLEMPFKDHHLSPWLTWGTEFSLRPRSEGQGPTPGPGRPPNHKHEVKVPWNTMENLCV